MRDAGHLSGVLQSLHKVSYLKGREQGLELPLAQGGGPASGFGLGTVTALNAQMFGHKNSNSNPRYSFLELSCWDCRMYTLSLPQAKGFRE